MINERYNFIASLLPFLKGRCIMYQWIIPSNDTKTEHINRVGLTYGIISSLFQNSNSKKKT